MNAFYPEGRLVGTADNEYYLSTPERLEAAARRGLILEAVAAVCSKEHDLYVDLPFGRAVIPREEGALGISEGTVRDIALLSRVGKPVCFVPVSAGNRAVLSRRAAQMQCFESYISHLAPGDVIDATVTHLEQFGAFADIGCGISSLIPIDAISVSRIAHPGDRFETGMNIRAVVTGREGAGRICLSHKELLGTWEENAAMFSIGETVAGIIRSVEDYGVFVELTPNLAGLAEAKEGILPGQQASVYIKNIIPKRMKVKLIIIDTFDYSYSLPKPRYFYTDNHIDSFCYSPPESDKIIETVF